MTFDTVRNIYTMDLEKSLMILTMDIFVFRLKIIVDKLAIDSQN
jgi:hypothetical protein